MRMNGNLFCKYDKKQNVARVNNMRFIVTEQLSDLRTKTEITYTKTGPLGATGTYISRTLPTRTG